tara:strand:+ start:535 stop:1092 length:558 start_codon:yes stop_codon:yes gene_type:complete
MRNKKKIIDKLSFQPSETTNYMVSEFNNKINVREILFEGALSLHEFTPFLNEFFYNYLNNHIDIHSDLHLSIIHTKSSGDGVLSNNLHVFKGNLNKKEKIENNKDKVKDVLELFSLIYKLFITKTNDENVKSEQGYSKTSNKYRISVEFKTLVRGYLQFKNEIVPKVKKLFHIVDNDGIQVNDSS